MDDTESVIDAPAIPDIERIVPRETLKVEYVEGELAFLEDAQNQYGVDRATKITEEFCEAVCDAITPQRFWYLVAPCVPIKKTKSSIILPDHAVSNQGWTHGTGVILAHGPTVYRGITFQEQGLTQDDAPKVGEIVCYDPKTPKRMRFHWNGESRLIVLLPDHGINCTLKRSKIQLISYDLGFGSVG